MKEIYIPGDKLPTSVRVSRLNQNAVRKTGNVLYATVVGSVDEDMFMPFEMVYIPKEGDSIVGIVTDKRNIGYFIDTGTAYEGLILSRETRADFHVGDIIFAKGERIEEPDTVILSNPKLLDVGRILDVPSSKIPRLIGKEASMINMIKEKTGASILVGANGYVWISSKGKVNKAIQAINKIISKAHLTGLTDEITKFLG
ncbi:MAG: KH domain-containing protein [Candidatus Micrarchaeota archaeon]|nr:KH domain-containing protein [Candidatus Micrarchaeota archaeon]